jgi:hypothetical protein
MEATRSRPGDTHPGRLHERTAPYGGGSRVYLCQNRMPLHTTVIGPRPLPVR